MTAAKAPTTVASRDEAKELLDEKRLELRRGTWRGRQRGRLSFSAWAAEWWETWAADDRSPTTLAGAEIRLRLHVRPWFADRPIDKITPADVRRWQAQLARNLGPSHGGPLPVAGTADLPVRHGRGRDRHQPGPQGPPAQAPSRS